MRKEEEEEKKSKTNDRGHIGHVGTMGGCPCLLRLKCGEYSTFCLLHTWRMSLKLVRRMEAFVCSTRCQTSRLTNYETCMPLEAPCVSICPVHSLRLTEVRRAAARLPFVPQPFSPSSGSNSLLTNRHVIYNFARSPVVGSFEAFSLKHIQSCGEPREAFMRSAALCSPVGFTLTYSQPSGLRTGGGAPRHRAMGTHPPGLTVPLLVGTGSQGQPLDDCPRILQPGGPKPKSHFICLKRRWLPCILLQLGSLHRDAGYELAPNPGVLPTSPSSSLPS